MEVTRTQLLKVRKEQQAAGLMLAVKKQEEVRHWRALERCTAVQHAAGAAAYPGKPYTAAGQA
jgi:hypothetical protein